MIGLQVSSSFEGQINQCTNYIQVVGASLKCLTPKPYRKFPKKNRIEFQAWKRRKLNSEEAKHTQKEALHRASSRT